MEQDNTFKAAASKIDAASLDFVAACSSYAAEVARVDATHPGWRKMVGLHRWVRMQPGPIRALAESYAAADAIVLLTLFKRDRAILLTFFACALCAYIAA